MARANSTAAPVVVVGDIGGTNARLSLWQAGDHPQQLFAKTYPTTRETFEHVFTEFLNESKTAAAGHPSPQAAALAVAGAVAANRCAMTNTSWVVDGTELAQQHGFKVAILNDFEAVGYGIPALAPTDVVPINDRPQTPQAPIVVMGPGTGLGAAQLFWDSGIKDYKVVPGEGSHATFAPRGWKQKALARFAITRLGHVEIEQVACGSGLELIYDFLCSDETANRPQLLGGCGAPPPSKKTATEISTAALGGNDQLATEAVDMLMAIVGAEAGAMALRCLAYGGVYIAGGITPKLLPQARKGALLEGFLARSACRPRFQEILASMPLYVITNENVGQIGAREYARKLVLR